MKQRVVARTALLALLVTASLLAAFHWLRPARHSVFAEQADITAVARRYPNFSMEQRLAVIRARQSQLHPQWKDLSLAEIAERVIKWATSQAMPVQENANFSGNNTTISVPGTDFLGISRQSDCSLTLRDAPYTLNFETLKLSYTLAGSVAHYDQVLHQEAALTTTPGKFPAGCGDPVLGISARKIVYLGMTTQALKVYAGSFYNSMLGQQQIFTLIAKSDDTWVSSETLAGGNSSDLTINLAAADLNGDGNGDLVAVLGSSLGNSGQLLVYLGNADGSFQAPTTYTLPGYVANSAVIDDVNGDGKLDIVASSSNSTGYQISFLAGKGDGTFAAPQSTPVATPPSLSFGAYDGLITADLRGTGKKDLITRTGIVLLGNGDGTFTASATPAFPHGYATSDMGPNVVAGDWNKDGKLDLAVSNGAFVSLYVGAGDGTFTAGPTYASIADVGYINALDLDGDGNVDLYIGLANGGMVGGDSFSFGQGYALMGRGDGTFAGAPIAPFVSTGTNIADLNGDKIIDGVGVTATNTGVSFTSYLGHADGTLTPSSTLVASPVTLGGQNYSFYTINSYGLGDVNGDGIADLVYVSGDINNIYFVATGKGDGSFNTPTVVKVPTLTPPPDTDTGGNISQVFVADFNHDGKADVIYNYVDYDLTTQNNVYGLAVQLSNGDGTFQPAKTIQSYSGTSSNPPPPSSTLTVDQIGDVNGDGYADLFVIRFSTTTDSQGSYFQQVFLYLGNGDGSFQAPTMPPIAGNPQFNNGFGFGPLVLADMNGDGHTDIVSLGSNGSTGVVAVSLGRGDGTFASPVTTGNAGSVHLAVGDFNGDGKPDVLVSGFTPPFDTGIYLGNGDGTLQGVASGNVTAPLLGIGLYIEGEAVATDFNGDGKLDIFSGGASLINQGLAGSTTPAGAASTTTLSASASTVPLGTSVTLTAKVTSMSPGIPTGTVTFSSGQTQLGTGTLDQTGTTTFTTSALALGTDSITAAYGGDATFAPSTSSPVTVTVTAAGSGFTVTLSPGSSTIAAGSSATATVSVNPTGGFNQPVALSCTGAPTASTCTIAPSAVTPNGSAATATLTLATNVSTALLEPAPPASAALAWLGGGAALGLVFLRRRRWAQYGLAALLAVGLCGLVQACGGGSKKSTGNNNTPAGNYTLTVTGTSGSTTQTATYSVTVQ